MAISTFEVPAHSIQSMEQTEPAEPKSFVEAARLQKAVKEELTAILASPSFRNSKKSCEFLHYIVQVALDGRVDSLKERSIGLDLLGRDTSYDPSSDATVRVRANEVRKRLKYFYSTQGPKSGYRIELLPGSYNPKFVHVVNHDDLSEVREQNRTAGEPKAWVASQPDVPPVSYVDIMRPTFIALFICALFLRHQIMSGDPYHQFWNARLQGKNAMILTAETSNFTATENNLKAILPIVWLAGRYDLKPILKEPNSENEVKQDDESNAATIHGSLATPSFLADDRRLRYLIAGSPGKLHLVDRMDPTQAVPDDLRGAVLTMLPDHPATMWIAGTDAESMNRLAEMLASKDSFPTQLDADTIAGHVVQIVLRSSSPHIEIYVP